MNKIISDVMTDAWIDMYLLLINMSSDLMPLSHAKPAVCEKPETSVHGSRANFCQGTTEIKL